MSIVTAYQCDKTKKLFVEKPKYIQHLKTQALEEFVKNRAHPRFKLLQRKFEEMRVSVRSFDELSQWLLAHPRYLEHLLVRNRVLTTKPLKKKTKIESIEWEDVTFIPYCTGGYGKPRNHPRSLDREEDAKVAYPAFSGDLKFSSTNNLSVHYALSSVLPVHTGGGGSNGKDSQYRFTLYAEDWPFLGAQALYNWRNQQVRKEQKRILKYAFPSMDEAYYLSLHGSGLLPDSPEDFLEFMFKFVGDAKAVALPDVSLPEELSGQDNTSM